MTTFVPNWGGNVSVLNVKDFGAVGNGSTNDTAAVQAALYAAFGTTSAGVSANPRNFLNNSLYFPKGNYSIQSPLYLRAVVGGKIFGDGPQQSQLFYQGDGTQGNTDDPGHPTYCPLFMLNGVQNLLIEGLSFANDTTVFPNTNSNSIGFWAFQDGNHGTTTANVFLNCMFSNFYGGILAYSSNGGSCDNHVLINVLFVNCAKYGVFTGTGNALNWQVYGGGGSTCAWLNTYDPDNGVFTGPGAVYLASTGGIGVICGTSCSANAWDILNFAGQMIVMGSSHEGPTYYSPASSNGITWAATSGGTATFTNFSSNPLVGFPTAGNTVRIQIYNTNPSGYAFKGVATMVNDHQFTYPLVSNPGAFVGQVVGGLGCAQRTDTGVISTNGVSTTVSGVSFRPTNSITRMLDISGSGTIVGDALQFSAGNNVGFGSMATLNGGPLILNGPSFGGNYAVMGFSGGNGKLYIRGSVFSSGVNSSLFTNLSSSNVVAEFDQLIGTTVSALPTAAAKFKGLQGSVTDGTASLAWGATVTGGGSTFYEVACNGSAWTVTGK